MKQKDQIRTQLQKKLQKLFQFLQNKSSASRNWSPSPSKRSDIFFGFFTNPQNVSFTFFLLHLKDIHWNFSGSFALTNWPGMYWDAWPDLFQPCLEYKHWTNVKYAQIQIQIHVYLSLSYGQWGDQDMGQMISKVATLRSWVFHERSFSWSSEVSSSLWSSVSKVTSLSLPIFSGQAGTRSSSSPVSWSMW